MKKEIFSGNRSGKSLAIEREVRRHVRNLRRQGKTAKVLRIGSVQ